MDVQREPRVGRERVESVDARACGSHQQAEALPPVQAASARRTAAWVRGLDRLSRRRPDAVGVTALARVTLDSVRASA